MIIAPHNFSEVDPGSNASRWPLSPPLPAGVSAQCVFVLALFAVVILVSVVGNVVVLCVLSRYRRVASLTNALVASLSVCDLVLTLTSVFAVAVVMATARGRHGYGDAAGSACTLVATFNGVFGGLSTCVVCMIAADRYYAVVTLPRRRFTKATLCNAVAAAAVSVSVLYFPWHAAHAAGCPHLLGVANTSHRVALVARVVFYVTTCVVEVFFCAQFFKVLRYSCGQVRPASVAVQQLRFLGEMHTLTTVLILVGVQLACRSGLLLLRPLVALVGWREDDATKIVSTWLFLANGAVNPTVYMLRNPLVVAAFRRLPQCRCRAPDHSRAPLAYATGSASSGDVSSGAQVLGWCDDVRDTTVGASQPPCVFYVSGR